MPLARRARATAPLVLGLAMLGAFVAPAAGVEPIDARDALTSQPAPPVRFTLPRTRPPAPARTPTPTARPTPTPTPTPLATPEIGVDVSYPQCGSELPQDVAFAIVGVNGGRVHSPNRCLTVEDGAGGQLVWAGQEVELYANTANPGPRDSRYWPVGQTSPRSCTAPGLLETTDTIDCAYVYGWNAAADSYRIALEAFVAAGWAEEGADALPWPTTWWLDVETANSWRSDRALNVAALEGARDLLESKGVAEVGFYSTPRMWARITGDTETFADHPAWHAGASDLADATRRCEAEEPFTGGELRMVQWVEDGLDRNLRCS